MKVFISYRRSDDRGGVGRLFDVLEARYGRGMVFVDVDSAMPLGTDFRSYRANQVEGADIVLAVIGPDWLRLIREKAADPKDFVRLEIEAALQRGIPVVPVLMGGTIPAEEDLPASIAQFAFLNGMIVDTGADFRHHAAKLCGKLDASVAPLAATITAEKVEAKPSAGASGFLDEPALIDAVSIGGVVGLWMVCGSDVSVVEVGVIEVAVSVGVIGGAIIAPLYSGRAKKGQNPA